MKLKEFQITNYRSINDSGLINVSQQTSLVGRNESGKTNILLALQSLNPSDRTPSELSFVKDFPRDRHPNEFSEDIEVVFTRWILTEQEQQDLVKTFPRAKGVSEIIVTRPYKPQLKIRFVNLHELKVDN